MSLNGLENVGSAANVITETKSNELGKDAFMELLVTQLQYQDPLSPMDSTAFTAQLAQFSSLEQLTGINDNLEYLQLYQSSINNSQAVSFIGKDIKAIGDTVNLVDGISGGLPFELFDDATEVSVNIYDSDDNLIKTIDGGALSTGEHILEWDGLDNEGNSVNDGEFKFEVTAVDEKDNPVKVYTYISGRVSGVTFQNGIASLLVGGHEVPVGDVIEVVGNTDSMSI